MSQYDVIVVGCGGVGSAALMHLAQRGARVLGIDRYAPPHDQGSTHGQTRVIRQAYFEHPDYVPLILRSYELWEELGQTVDRRLLHETGLVEIGPANGVVVPGVLRAAKLHNLEVEHFSGDEVTRRWLGLQCPEGLEAVFEKQAGYLPVELCVQSQLEVAANCKATLLRNTCLVDWSATQRDVRVKTTSGEFTAKSLVFAAGAWADQLLADLNCGLSVLQKTMLWFKCDDKHYNISSGMPVFLYELPTGIYYGFPEMDVLGVKISEHSGGEKVDNPDELDLSVVPRDERRLQDFLSTCLPGVSQHVNHYATCMYTMTSDAHFVVDQHPDFQNVILAAGLSGHGFKFTPVLGEILADLSLEGTTDAPIEFLSMKRPGILS